MWHEHDVRACAWSCTNACRGSIDRSMRRAQHALCSIDDDDMDALNDEFLDEQARPPRGAHRTPVIQHTRRARAMQVCFVTGVCCMLHRAEAFTAQTHACAREREAHGYAFAVAMTVSEWVVR
jgi:hypothetical protein